MMRKSGMTLCTIVVTSLIAACDQPAQDDMADSAPAVIDEVQAESEQYANNARGALMEIQEEIAEIDARYADVQGRAAEAWEATQDELMQVQQQAQAVVMRMQGATNEEARTLKEAAGDAVEALAHHVERARLDAEQDARQFVATSQATLGEIDEDLQSMSNQTVSLGVEARVATMHEIEDLKSEAEDLTGRVDTIAEATPEQIADARSDLTEEIASLSASVRRQWLDLANAIAAE